MLCSTSGTGGYPVGNTSFAHWAPATACGPNPRALGEEERFAVRPGHLHCLLLLAVLHGRSLRVLSWSYESTRERCQVHSSEHSTLNIDMTGSTPSAFDVSSVGDQG